MKLEIIMKKKQTNKQQNKNTIITQSYHSGCCSWKLSSKARIAWDFSTRIQQGEKRKRCETGFPTFTSGVFLNQKFNKKPAMNNKRLLLAAVFHFVHPVEKDT